MFGRRPDGKRVEGLSALRRFMPFIMPQRQLALVYFSQEINVEAALRHIEELNRTRSLEDRVTLFHMVLHGLVRVFSERPRLPHCLRAQSCTSMDGTR